MLSIRNIFEDILEAGRGIKIISWIANANLVINDNEECFPARDTNDAINHYILLFANVKQR